MAANSIDIKQKYSISQLGEIKIDLEKPKVVFLYGDLWAWKTTLSQHILSNLLGVSEDICSPTYTYYNKYGQHYHFDLYRLSNYDEFFAIWGEEILDNNNSGVILVEWPELISNYYASDISIYIEKTVKDTEREITIVYNIKGK